MASVQNDDDFSQRFPREKSWNALGDLYQYEGFWYLESLLEGIVKAQTNFKAKSTDIFVASHLKTGTTWLKALSFAIATRSSFPDLSTSPSLFKMPHDCIPFLEFDLSSDHSTIRDDKNPLVSTHIPFNSLPKSVMESGCKIVYIWRDPKDVFVSLWHFICRVQMSKNIVQPCLSLEEAFEQFFQGKSIYGPYWEHVLGYWKAKLEFPDNILFLKYEDMRKDTRSYVTKLAEFIGYPFSVDEEDNGIVEKIIDMCSFENLSNLEVNKNEYIEQIHFGAITNNLYYRKGEIEDWKNELNSLNGSSIRFLNETKIKWSRLLEEIAIENFVVDEEDNGIVEKIIDMCSFENLSNLEVNKSGVHRANTPVAINNNLYYRKGEIGDWKNELTVEMGARLDSLMKQKLSGFGLLEEIASSSQSM